jgi:hypothetical protein
MITQSSSRMAIYDDLLTIDTRLEIINCELIQEVVNYCGVLAARRCLLLGPGAL